MKKVLWISVPVLLAAVAAKAQTIASSGNVELVPAENDGKVQSVPAPDLMPGTGGGPQRMPPMSAGEKLRYMIKADCDPGSIGFSMAGAAMKHARDSVPEWGQGLEGYAKRLGSSLGQRAVNQGLEFAAGYLLHEDPRYYFSESRGFWRRSLYAVSRTFVSNKDGGGIRPGYSKFLATSGSVYLARQWYPENKQNAREYLVSIAVSIGADTVGNIFSEFWPDLKKILHRRN